MSGRCSEGKECSIALNFMSQVTVGGSDEEP